MIKRNNGSSTHFQNHAAAGGLIKSERTGGLIGKNDSECSFTLTDDEDRENMDSANNLHNGSTQKRRRNRGGTHANSRNGSKQKKKTLSPKGLTESDL
jgi:hypothetical protein